jgi:hypothetical protein
MTETTTPDGWPLKTGITCTCATQCNNRDGGKTITPRSILFYLRPWCDCPCHAGEYARLMTMGNLPRRYWGSSSPDAKE